MLGFCGKLHHVIPSIVHQWLVWVSWDWCNMLKCSLQRRVVENWPVFWKKFTSETFSWQLRWQRSFLQKVGTQLAKPWTRTQIKHAVTTSADMSSLGGCEMRWMSRDEGSDRWSRSLVCSSVMGVEDARMTFVEEREIGWCEILSRADECSSLVKLSRFMSVVL